ncbi:MAG: DUF2800 domain-containing protein [bacterium]|nr:DUF2800 domain-containing protein [bacterium]
MNEQLKSFSYSGISSFRNCPKSFAYKYIEKLPSAFFSIEAHMGSAVHEVLEWAYKERMESREPDLPAALEEFKQAFWKSPELPHTKVIKSGATVDDYFSRGKLYVSYFLNMVFPNDKSETIYLEHRFNVMLTEEVKFRGIIDRVSREEDGTLRITDYKTGKVTHPLENLQLPSYAMYTFENNIDMEIRLCLEDLREKRSITASFPRKEAKRVKAQLVESINLIRSTENFITTPTMLCQWCGFNHICPTPHESVANPMAFKKFQEYNPRQAGVAVAYDSKYAPDPASAPVPGTTPNAAPANGTGAEGLEGCCPKCGGHLRKRKGKYGDFMGCGNYPQCNYTYNLAPSGQAETVTPETEGKYICPECGSLLKEKKGKYGTFIGCSGYPNCRFTRQIEETSEA